MVEPAKGGTPNENGETGGSTGAVLRKMMTTDKKGQALPITEIVRLERKDNLFRFVFCLLSLKKLLWRRHAKDRAR